MLISTVSKGSTKTVEPDALWSTKTPLTLFLELSLTGNVSLPSLEAMISSRKNPELFHCFIIRPKAARACNFSEAIVERMRFNSGLAESRISPVSSMAWRTAFSNSSNEDMEAVIFARNFAFPALPARNFFTSRAQHKVAATFSKTSAFSIAPATEAVFKSCLKS